jgi:crotonobetainyl-CoA:carnitine CoA-transferase CaiB-like acyl-CoA transferase
MTDLKDKLTADIWAALGGPATLLSSVTFSASAGALPSLYPVTELAAASIAAAGLAVAELVGATPQVEVDPRLASYWFKSTIKPVGWEMASPWGPIAGDYRTKDGWIRLHTNAPHHEAAVKRVLGDHNDKPTMAKAVAQWAGTDLETAIVAAGGCAAEMRSEEAWATHPQGRAVAAEPLVHLATRATTKSSWTPDAARPLKGLRVLDLTRILAGPIASRFLAGFGADVLRIDPPDWDEPGVLPEVTLGKRCARLDLLKESDRRVLQELMSRADILFHGYRPGALDGLGFDAATRRKLAPALIDVSLCAYGVKGPWATRRGFDSLLQMSSGIADSGMKWKQSDTPSPLPAQALDHATGYMMAAAAIRALTRRMTSGEATTARLSLARTGKLLTDQPRHPVEKALAPLTDSDYAPAIEPSGWGDARRLKAPLSVAHAPMQWSPAQKLGTAQAVWQ